MLRSDDPEGFSSGAPIIRKGVEVGRIGDTRLNADGRLVEAEAVVFPPYDALVNASTRFWDSGGADFSLGAAGASLSVPSITSLVSGSISFDTIVPDAAPVEDGTAFRIYDDEAAARRSVFDAPVPGDEIQVVAVFGGEASDLSPGAAVTYGGITAGEVTAVEGVIDPTAFSDGAVRVRAVLSLRPSRLGLPEGTDPLEALSAEVAEGLRARLASASLLGGGLKVDLSDVPGAAPAAIDLAATPLPALPTAPGLVSGGLSADGVLTRLAALPVEDLADATLSLITGAARLVNDPELQAVPAEVRGAVADLRGVIGAPAVQALPAQIGATAEELAASVADLRAILAGLEEADTVAAITEAVDAVSEAADDVVESVEGVPELVGYLNDVAAQVAAAPLTQTVEELRTVAASVAELTSAEATQALPERLGAVAEGLAAATGDLQAILAQVNRGGFVARAGEALEAVSAAAAAAAASLDGVPALVEGLRGVTGQVAAAPIAETLEALRTAAVGVAALAASEETQALPGEISALASRLAGAADQLQGLLAAVEAEGTLARAGAALDAVASAAGGAEAALDGVPSLLAELEAVAAQIRALPLAEAVGTADALLADLDALVAQEAVRALPADLSATLAELRALAADLRQAGLAQRLGETLEAAAAAATSIETAAAGTPELVENLRQLSATARDLPLEELTVRASDLIAAGEAILATEAARDLPASLGGTLDEVRGALADLRAGGTVENVNAALAAARGAAEEVAGASAALPALLDSIRLLLDQAQGTLAAYDGSSEVSRGALAAIRNVAAAAEAVQSLARTIERRPNSLLLGR